MNRILVAVKAVSLAVKAFTAFVLLFLVLPLVTMLSASFAGGQSQILSFPPQGFSLSWYYVLLTDPDFLQGLWVSLLLGVGASICSLLIAMGLCTALRRTSGSEILHSYALSPLLIPGVVVGLSLLQLFRAVGLFGSFFSLFLAHIVITMPYAIRTLGAIFTSVDASLEDAARTLGANEFQTFRYVTLRLIQAGLIASFMFGFVISLNEISMTAFLIKPGLTTVSMVVFGWSTTLYTPILAAASGLFSISTLLFLLIADRVIGLDKAMAFVAYR
ncbi:MAG TPA: ABC transporter permease subunit [Candidatus Bathyarchaeia archaeon]|nr:ABC transporter permease subunit [Candidatus Bathyarchaeia archaeon]